MMIPRLSVIGSARHRTCLSVLLASLLLSLLFLGRAEGQIVRDGSLGQTAGALTGPNYTIGVQNPAQQIRGNNLFHSFSDFNVNTGQGATFVGPNNIANIISRVTGQNISNIDGTIISRNTMPTANFFLINPNGLVVGPNAFLMVGGSVHFSTADYLRLGSGNDRFYADLSKTSQLTSAPVTAFGFFGKTPGKIDIRGDSDLPLRVPENQTVSVLAGDISIQGRIIEAPGGQINLVSVLTGEVSLSDGGPQLSPGSLLGNIRLTAMPTGFRLPQSTILAVSTKDLSKPPGNIFIRSGQIVMEDSVLTASNLSDIPIKTLDISGGIISLTASSINVSNSLLRSKTYGANDAGFMTFKGQDIILQNNTVLEANSSNFSVVPDPTLVAGKAGAITIEGINGPAHNITIKNSTIDAKSGSGSKKDNPPADIRITSQMVTLDHAQITVSAEGEAPGGNFRIDGANSIFITNSTVSTSAAKSSGGNIMLTAPNMVRLVGANLTSSVFGPKGSNGGNISIDTAHPQFVIMQGHSQILAKANEGQGGRITIIGGVVLQEPGSVLDATAGPAGISGSINIQAPIQQLSGAIAPLPQAFAVATNLYGQRCAAEKGGQFSSFVQGARDGVPPQPGDLIPSPLMLELDEVSFSRGSQSTSSLSTIRLGLPKFEQTSRSSLTVFAGCRS
jgi:filamentous hemagglutinin family protein